MKRLMVLPMTFLLASCIGIDAPEASTAALEETEAVPDVASSTTDNSSSAKVMRPEVLYMLLRNTFGLGPSDYPSRHLNDYADWGWSSVGGIDYYATTTRPDRPTTAMALAGSGWVAGELCYQLVEHTDDGNEEATFRDAQGNIELDFSDWESGAGAGAAWEATTQKIATLLRSRRASSDELSDVLELLAYVHGPTESGGLGLDDDPAEFWMQDANMVCKYFMMVDGGFLAY